MQLSIFKTALFILLFSPVIVSAQTVTLIVTGITELEGKIIAGIYSPENDFPVRGKSMQKRVVEANAKQITITFTNIANGNYAIAVFHDKDNNSEMNKNFIGIPQEKFGFSNKSLPGAFSPPDFAEAKFKVAGNTKHNIKIIEW